MNACQRLQCVAGRCFRAWTAPTRLEAGHNGSRVSRNSGSIHSSGDGERLHACPFRASNGARPGPRTARPPRNRWRCSRTDAAKKRAPHAFACEASWGGSPTWARTRDLRTNRCMAHPSVRMSVNEEARSDLLHKLRLQPHRADPVDLAVDVVVAIGQADVLDLGADLDDQG